jgi:hypothetical protein
VLFLDSIWGAGAGGRLVFTLTGGTNHLVITSVDLGSDASIWIKGGTALPTLGLTLGTTAYGALGKTTVGDELFIDGISAGIIIGVAPGGQVDTLKINVQLPITTDEGTHWYIIAKNLVVGAVNRPTPDLVVGSDVTVTLKNSLLRDTTGNPLPPTQGRAPVYASYMAIRKDLTSVAANASLIRIDNQTQLESVMAPVSTTNPLALGMFFALVNAPGVQITGLGVDAVSASEPFGTADAFARAAEFLEAFEVYALAPLTHEQTVGQIFNTHVNLGSQWKHCRWHRPGFRHGYPQFGSPAAQQRDKSGRNDSRRGWCVLGHRQRCLELFHLQHKRLVHQHPDCWLRTRHQ